jgi:hypothetical protein
MKKYNEFIDSNEQLNEGIFDFLKKMWNKAAAHIRKIKGGKEVDAIFTKYLGIINAEIQKKANVTLQLGGEEKITKESIILRYDQFLNEEAETDMESDVEISEEDKKKVQQSGEKDKQMDAKTLKEKEKIIEQIINLYKDKALKEMEQVLKKQGGAEKNPKLKIIIDNKMHEFNLKFLEAKVKFLEKSGDKSAMNKVAVERDKKAKELENMWKQLDEKGDVKTEGEGDYKVGNRYRYNTENGQKNIEIVGTSDKEGMIKAKYLNKEDGKIIPQDFRRENIDKDDNTLTDGTYGYRSNEGKGELIEVEIKGNKPENKNIKVTSVKTGKEFIVDTGLLRKK